MIYLIGSCEVVIQLHLLTDPIGSDPRAPTCLSATVCLKIPDVHLVSCHTAAAWIETVSERGWRQKDVWKSER